MCSIFFPLIRSHIPLHPRTTMKVACLLITHLRARVEVRRYPDLKDRPAVIVDRSEVRAVVADFTSCTTGVSFGMTLEEALSIRPEALVIEADEPHYRRVFAQALASLQGISDRVEGSEVGTAYIRLDGLERMYGGEARLVNVLLNAMPQDLVPRAGVAEAKFPALVAARMSKPLGATRGPARRRVIPGPSLRRSLAYRWRYKDGAAPIRLPYHGGCGLLDRGRPGRPVRVRGRQGMASLPGHG